LRVSGIGADAHCREGLVKIEFGPPLESTAARAKGYNAGLIAVLEKPEDVKVYAEHPVHQKYVLVTFWYISRL